VVIWYIFPCFGILYKEKIWQLCLQDVRKQLLWSSPLGPQWGLEWLCNFCSNKVCNFCSNKVCVCVTKVFFLLKNWSRNNTLVITNFVPIYFYYIFQYLSFLYRNLATEREQNRLGDRKPFSNKCRLSLFEQIFLRTNAFCLHSFQKFILRTNTVLIIRTKLSLNK
jgi:hypothetical protein